MGTELVRVCVKEESDDCPSVPPGFESYTSFTIMKMDESQKQDEDNLTSCLLSTSTSERQSVHMDTEIDTTRAAKITRSLRRRQGTNYGQADNCPDDVFDSEQNFSTRPLLSKGVIRGCAECSTCQKVTARWRPEDSRRPDLEDAPVFYPTEEEFEDTLSYIASIRPKAEAYGICRIVPPSSWKAPCPLTEKTIWESSKFATRVQRIDKLQNRDSVRKISRLHNQMRRKRRRCARMGVDSASNNGGLGDAGTYEAETFGFEPGPEFTLETFQKYADDFKAQYFGGKDSEIVTGGNMRLSEQHPGPSVENIEGEYWRMVEKPSEEIEVLYGADLETGVFGSGFPKVSSQGGSASDEKYVKSGWNLNNFPRLPGSVLCHESSDISGVLVPWLYIGMCFSSFCWHVEDHHLYSLNYMHWGEPKIWYGVPGKDACRLEETMRKYLPDLFEEQPDLLHKLVTQLSPSILKSNGVPVYRCAQNPGEFVLTFPRAYHSGFNCGFNCAEAVNVAPVDWLPHGQIAIDLYRQQGRKTSISHDKLLLGAAREAVRAQWELNLLKKNTSNNLRWKDVCGKEGILANTFKKRVEMESAGRNSLCSSSPTVKMECSFDATSERECSFCLFDLHLSAVGCRCSPDIYVCVNHAKQLCSCAWGARFFLFRYDINELNILVEALEGKLSAIYRWARLDLGLALSSYISKDKLHTSKLSPEGADFKNRSSHQPTNSLKDPQCIKSCREVLKTATGNAADICSQQKNNLSEPVSPLKVTEAPSASHVFLERLKKIDHDSHLKKEHDIVPSNLKTPICQLSKEDTLYADPDWEKNRENMASVLVPDDVILLSDDEDDEPMKPVLDRERESSLTKNVEKPDRLVDLGAKASLCNNVKSAILTPPVTDAAVMDEKYVNFVSDKKLVDLFHTVGIKTEQVENDGMLLEDSDPVGRNGAELGRNGQLVSTPTDAKDGQSKICSTGNPNDEDKRESMGSNTPSNLLENGRTLPGNTSCSQNSLNRYIRQKGPRIAKVVRRINCNVEPLEFGVVISGKSWSNSRGIFPKGFKSRVRYISVIDPTNMSYYFSEILDAERNEPLFMVSLEQCPSEVFIHISAARCWELVRERVNQEITKQHKMGRANLPPLQPPGSLDGFEMFGFTSPAIVQAIEAMDRNRICTEYWESRPYSRPHVQIPQASQFTDGGGNSHKVWGGRKAPPRTNLLPGGVDTILRGLFKKANPEELNSLSNILSNNKLTDDQDLVTQLLDEELLRRSSSR